ncbi:MULTISPECIES: helix-turn-helix domain-containing protein [Vibrio]|nr:helix-turn-helix domain-containing protein [Vibrio cholerae]
MENMMLITSPRQLGIYLRDVRRTQKRNQTLVGDIVGLKQTTVSKLERDPASSSIESLMRLLSSLNLELHIEEKVVGRDPGKFDPDDW